MISVIDVSGAVEIILQKEKKDLFNGMYKESAWVIAADLYVSGLSNVLWKYCKAGVITHDECIQYVEDGICFLQEIFPKSCKSFFPKVATGNS